MVAGSTSPRIGKSNWLATSSRVTVSSPQEKKMCGWWRTTGEPNGKGYRGLESWIGFKIGQWLSKHRPAEVNP